MTYQNFLTQVSLMFEAQGGNQMLIDHSGRDATGEFIQAEHPKS